MSSEKGKLSFTLDKSKLKPSPPNVSPSPLLSTPNVSSKKAIDKHAHSIIEYMDQRESSSESTSKLKESMISAEKAPDVIFEPLDLNVYGLQERRIKSGSLSKSTSETLPPWLRRPKMDPQDALEHDLKRIEELNATREAQEGEHLTSEEDASNEEMDLNAIKTLVGWKDGQRVGKPRKAVTEGVIYRDIATPIQFLSRPELVGLGYKVEGEVDHSQGGNKPRVVVGIDEKMIIKRIGKGSKVIIKDGEHAGLTGVVIYFDRESIEVSLDVSEERVLLPFESCGLLETVQQKTTEREGMEAVKDDPGEWLHTGLVVRFVSRSWREGRYYNKRGTIEDIHKDPQTAITMCTVSLQSDRREIIHHVPPSAITPCPPVMGRPVIILRTVHAGSIARLVEQMPHDCWIVQLDDSMELVTVVSKDLGELTRQ